MVLFVVLVKHLVRWYRVRHKHHSPYSSKSSFISCQMRADRVIKIQWVFKTIVLCLFVRVDLSLTCCQALNPSTVVLWPAGE